MKQELPMVQPNAAPREDARAFVDPAQFESTAELEDIEFPVSVADGHVTLRLRRFRGRPAERRPAVMFVHGGNSRSDTFLLPHGGVILYLWNNGFDVWLLDWRGSPFVLQQLAGTNPIGGSEEVERLSYTLDDVARLDIPEALARVRAEIGHDTPLSVVAHCLGAGIASMAAARGALAGVRNLVLSTLGLFFEVPWNGWIKAEDFILERVITNTPRCRWVDPTAPDEWPPAMASAYGHWPDAWNAEGTSPDAELLKRLTFMVGRPFALERLHPSIKGELLRHQFGPLHLGLYMHASQVIRRGFVDRFGEPDVIDRPRALRRVQCLPPTGYYFQPEPWAELRVTLIGGSEDQVWHRDSLDLMYEWLRALPSPRWNRCRKHIVRGYRLQELYWAASAQKEVYPLFLAALRR